MSINRKLKTLLFILCLMTSKSQATAIYLNDGQYHILDYYETVQILVDCGDGDTLGTTLEIIQNGKCSAAVGNNGKITLKGGILEYIYAEQNSLVTILNGALNNRYTGKGESHLEMSGGTIDAGDSEYARGIWLRNYSTATISGGTITGKLVAWNSSSITLVGNNFAINGISINLYEDIKNYATYECIDSDVYGYTGVITGTLSDGSSLNNYFEIWDTGGVSNANIYLVPEPCSLALLGLGGLAVFRRRRVYSFGDKPLRMNRWAN